MGQTPSLQEQAQQLLDGSIAEMANGPKIVVNTDQAPAAVGPYSQGILAPFGAKMLFCAGQVGLDPKTNKLVAGSVGDQTKQALTNLKAVLEQAGSSMDKVVKTTVFLTEMKHLQEMNAVYNTFFEVFPARSTVAVKELPLSALVEIEAIAFTSKPIEQPITTFSSATLLRADGKTPIPLFVAGKVGNPGIIVIQEWWGVTDQVKKHALRLANQGYRVAIPDIYRGKVGVDAEEASHLMHELDWVGAIEDIRGITQGLKKEGSPRVGCVGHCMGGALAIASATNLPADLDCAISFYGIPPKTLADPGKNLKIPLQCHFGEKDDLTGFSDRVAAEALEKELQKSGVKHELYMYPNVGHAFMNDLDKWVEMKKKLGQIGGANGAIHDPEAISLAWSRTFAFFLRHLKSNL